MTEDNIYPYELIHKAHMDWVDKDDAARMLEETKSLVFSQRCKALGDIPVNRAEQIVKADPDWYNWIVGMVTGRTTANRAKAEYEYQRNKKEHYMNEQANERTWH